MAVLSITRLRLRRWRFYPAFLWYALASARQSERTPGFRGGWLGTSGPRTFWTATAWDDERAMRAFRDHDRHASAMPRLLGWCDEASVARWTQPTPDLPDGDEALRALTALGRLSKVRHPSSAHREGSAVSDGRAPRPGKQLRPRSRP